MGGSTAAFTDPALLATCHSTGNPTRTPWRQEAARGQIAEAQQIDTDVGPVSVHADDGRLFDVLQKSSSCPSLLRIIRRPARSSVLMSTGFRDVGGKVLARRPPFVSGAEQAAALQLRNHQIDKIVERARQQDWRLTRAADIGGFDCRPAAT
ncbi:hypothetical protein X743_10215 [Mesorhizobium sp. LNHC252B00]|nr:hypothetical protein X743_10215 [Mesorhizobium sp. LNHC252B00]